MGKIRRTMLLDAFQLNVVFATVLLVVVCMFAYAARSLVENQRHGRTDKMEDPYQWDERFY